MSDVTATPPATPIWQLSVAQYYAMIDTGILTDDDSGGIAGRPAGVQDAEETPAPWAVAGEDLVPVVWETQQG